MERIRRDDYTAQVSNLLGKGEAVVLTGHRRAGLIHDSGIVACSARQFLLNFEH